MRAIVLRGGAVVAAGADRTFVAGSQPQPHDARRRRVGHGDDGPGGPGGGGTDDRHDAPTPGGAGNQRRPEPAVFKVPKATMRSW